MFGTLIESRAMPQRRTGSSLASVAIHAAIITVAVVATASHGPFAAPAPLEVHVVHFAQPELHPAPTRAIAVANAAVAAMPSIPRLNVPSVTPIGIPPVDLSVVPTVDYSGQGPIMNSRITCDRDCGTGPVTDAGGRALWSTSDVLMRLLADPVPPRYPESLRRAGVEGDVVVRFLVDTTGRVDMRTLEVVRSTHEAFTAAVRETLSKLRFSPAMAGERKANALAVMPFRFTLR
jgi:periplasmic protein TonB